MEVGESANIGWGLFRDGMSILSAVLTWRAAETTNLTRTVLRLPQNSSSLDIPKHYKDRVTASVSSKTEPYFTLFTELYELIPDDAGSYELEIRLDGKTLHHSIRLVIVGKYRPIFVYPVDVVKELGVWFDSAKLTMSTHITKT